MRGLLIVVGVMLCFQAIEARELIYSKRSNSELVVNCGQEGRTVYLPVTMEVIPSDAEVEVLHYENGVTDYTYEIITWPEEIAGWSYDVIHEFYHYDTSVEVHADGIQGSDGLGGTHNGTGGGNNTAYGIYEVYLDFLPTGCEYVIVTRDKMVQATTPCGAHRNEP